jgi:hypothetical protein
MKRRKRTKWTKKRLDILFECWKEAEKNKDKLELIKKHLPEIPPLAGLNKMRSMVNYDTKWINAAQRRKERKEKEKLAEQKEKEKKKIQREKRKIEREIKQKKRSKKEKIRNKLSNDLVELIKEKIESEFSFCPDIQQYVNNLSCIFRVFGQQHDYFSGACESCTRMDKYVSIIEEVLNAQQKARRNKASKRGRKTKVKKDGAKS